MTRSRLRRAAAAATAAVALVIAGCGGDTDVSGGGGGDAAGGGSIATDYDLKGATLTIGSKEFTEQKVLGQIAIAAAQAAGAKTRNKTGITGTDTVRAALESGDIQLYWEYTGTGWVNILKKTPTNLPKDLFSAVAKADEANNISWIGPAPFNNTYAVAVTQKFADQNNIRSLSDAAKYTKANAGEATMCAASEFLNRDDGLPGLEKAYKTKFKVVEVEINLVYTQLGKDCNFGEVTSTDGRIKGNDLVVLEDDQGFFVPYNGAVTVKADVLKKYPDLEPLFKGIMGKLTDEKMVELNARVDIDGENEDDVARDYLASEGLIDAE